MQVKTKNLGQDGKTKTCQAVAISNLCVLLLVYLSPNVLVFGRDFKIKLLVFGFWFFFFFHICAALFPLTLYNQWKEREKFSQGRQ